MLTGVNAPASSPRQADVAYAGLRDLIVTLALPPGAALAEDELMRRLEVGRTPLREAVKRLEVENLVVVFPRRGTFVSEVHLTDHSLISDVRRQLESHAARRAAARATEADRARLRELAAEIKAHPGGRAASMRLDTAIHREIYRCAHNHYLERDLSHYYNLSLRIWYLFLDRLPEVDHTAEHLPVLQAILDGDGEAAATHAAQHVTHFEESVNAAL
ncbi:GntR family transcriptional regulator [Kineosporia rhizophila]|uniref:GntR family transcriptional regulator n=1 Tax=Kineosporia TaxID=49184 RepID=UPI001E527C06|nr:MULTISPECIES: GntR family transcriptional regulator [Kineosporia]MCE0535964.1 GntR family transcriptional regulator [Kineosporia rhizophila]GLY14206.1 GntR family transcriptional regulator [Kineosporia sp. NBRC 101677]